MYLLIVHSFVFNSTSIVNCLTQDRVENCFEFLIVHVSLITAIFVLKVKTLPLPIEQVMTRLSVFMSVCVSSG